MCNAGEHWVRRGLTGQKDLSGNKMLIVTLATWGYDLFHFLVDQLLLLEHPISCSTGILPI